MSRSEIYPTQNLLMRGDDGEDYDDDYDAVVGVKLYIVSFVISNVEVTMYWCEGLRMVLFSGGGNCFPVKARRSYQDCFPLRREGTRLHIAEITTFREFVVQRSAIDHGGSLRYIMISWNDVLDHTPYTSSFMAHG